MQHVGTVVGFPILRMTAQEDGCQFYCAMGPFFASREVRQSLDNYPLHDSLDHVWFVVQDAGQVIAFASVILGRPLRQGIGKLGDTVVLAPYQRRGIATALLAAREHEAIARGATRIDGIANERSQGYFERAGYQCTRQRGRFLYYTKEVR